MGAAVRAHGFSWRHAGRRDPALSDLDLRIDPGEKVLLLGASGAGKSTLLHAIAGVLPAESGYRSGELLVDGAPPDPRSGTTGLVLQDPDSQVILARLGDDVCFGMENLGVDPAAMPARARAALRTVGLDLPFEHPTAALSGGQKQRLALAGVLAMAPRLIVLDEPTANIDPAAVPEVVGAVLAARAAAEATLIVVEHRVDIWAAHVDRVIVLGAAGLIADGAPQTVLSDPDLHAALTAAGVWLPGAPLPTPRAPSLPARAGTLPASAAGSAAQAPAPEVLLGADDLLVSRPGRPRAVAAPGSIRIAAGQAIGLVGPNGAGKSTTALTLGGLLPEAGGQVRASVTLRPELSPRLPARLAHRLWGRRPADPARPHTWPARALVSRIGTVFQEPEHQFLTRSVAAELALGPQRAGLPAAEVEERVADLLARLRLNRLAGAHPHTLSGGEKRRLSVACMMATRPRVLIVDEPTFGQDALTWRELAALTCGLLDAGTAVLAVSHDEEFLTAIGAARLRFGPAAAPEAPAEVCWA